VSRWPVVPLREIAQFLSGGTPSKANPGFWCGSIPWVSPKDMGTDVIDSAEDHISEEGVAGSATRLVPEGTILVVARSGILARALPIGIAGCPVAFNQDIQAISVDRTRVEPAFAAAALKARTSLILSNGVKRGATVQSLSSGFLRDLPVLLPPLNEQRRMVDLMSRAAGIRRLHEAALTKARETIPALFLSMFGDPATNPMGWPAQPLGQVIQGFRGGKNLQAGDETEDRPRILKISAVTGGRFRSEESKPAPAGYAAQVEHFVRRGDLLITRANTAELVGAVALVDQDHSNLLLPDKIWRFVWRQPSPVASSFMQAFFGTAHVRNALRRMATGTSDSMRNISQAKLLTLPTPIPPLPRQQAFADRDADLRSIIAQQESALAIARDTERALMARLLG
jgi:type I restriction enzyme S subunit